MALVEEQIVRYSRQILLAQVGGQGQERLLGTCVRVLGVGAAQATAVAYLAASGCAVEERARPVQSDEVGFVYGAADAGSKADEVLGRAAYALNPDSVARAVARSEEGRTGYRTFGCIAELPAAFEGQGGHWVAMGSREGRAAVIFRHETGCAECFLGQAEGMDPLSQGPWPELVGALAALSLQRLVLEMSEPLGGVWVDGEARMTPVSFPHCRRCGA